MLTAPEGTGSSLQQPSMPAKDLGQGERGGSRKQTALGWRNSLRSRAPCLNTTVSSLHSTARHTIPHHTKAHTAPTSHPFASQDPPPVLVRFYIR